MFCVKGFADGKGADLCSGSAAIVIAGSNIAAATVARKPAGNNDGRQTFVTEKLSKQSSINGTDREPIANDGLHFPLWIKVPLPPLQPTSSLRRLPLQKAANKHVKP